MRKINRTSQFRKDYKRLLRSPEATAIEAEFLLVLSKLAHNQKLDAKYRDHPLRGNWKNHRDCHIRPDLVLLYRILEDENILKLVRIGSHSELEL